jgi:LPXTG-motif cell wall-anchored protein
MFLDLATTLNKGSTFLIIIGIIILLLSFGVIIYIVRKNKMKEGEIDEEII